ncbi:hypothetical protein V6Z11_A10G173400 [Gossypium hirsutum]|uniref:Uncharacterized protein n=1 Tax=Gossypium tomentosum TaxID=34277 RepID=A0A5D2NSH7_GOSTO|nr:hypothetical protein ES332_A10G178000v1 [Gossypium tomentosum]
MCRTKFKTNPNIKTPIKTQHKPKAQQITQNLTHISQPNTQNIEPTQHPSSRRKSAPQASSPSRVRRAPTFRIVLYFMPRSHASEISARANNSRRFSFYF